MAYNGWIIQSIKEPFFIYHRIIGCSRYAKHQCQFMPWPHICISFCLPEGFEDQCSNCFKSDIFVNFLAVFCIWFWLNTIEFTCAVFFFWHCRIVGKCFCDDVMSYLIHGRFISEYLSRYLNPRIRLFHLNIFERLNSEDCSLVICRVRCKLLVSSVVEPIQSHTT